LEGEVGGRDFEPSRETLSRRARRRVSPRKGHPLGRRFGTPAPIMVFERFVGTMMLAK
jgi:hypothetical protein